MTMTLAGRYVKVFSNGDFAFRYTYQTASKCAKSGGGQVAALHKTTREQELSIDAQQTYYVLTTAAQAYPVSVDSKHARSLGSDQFGRSDR